VQVPVNLLPAFRAPSTERQLYGVALRVAGGPPILDVPVKTGPDGTFRTVAVPIDRCHIPSASERELVAKAAAGAVSFTVVVAYAYRKNGRRHPTRESFGDVYPIRLTLVVSPSATPTASPSPVAPAAFLHAAPMGRHEPQRLTAQDRAQLDADMEDMLANLEISLDGWHPPDRPAPATVPRALGPYDLWEAPRRRWWRR
jgi:hypothetical protein